MKRLLLILALALMAFGVWAQSSFQVYDTLGRKHRNDTDFGSGSGSATNWSTFPAVTNVNMAGLDLTNASTVVANNYFGVIDPDNVPTFTQYGVNSVQSSSGNSYISVAPDFTFGSHNGEPAGVGADINLVSDNGHVVVSPDLTFATGGSISTVTFGATTMYFTADVLDFGDAQLTAQSILSVTDLSLSAPGGNINLNSPIIIATGDITTGGSYWAQGSQGGSGFSVLDADGVTTHAVVGGIIVP